jgi:hypothetical protein
MKGQLQSGDNFVSKPSMSNLRKPLLISLLAILACAALSGCVPPKQDSSIPWSRPADWEGRIPGMGK